MAVLALHGGSAADPRRSAAPACTDQASADPPLFIYPDQDETFSSGGDYVFHVDAVPGATSYHWEVVQHELRLAEVEQRVAGRGLQGVIAHYFEYLAQANPNWTAAFPSGGFSLEPGSDLVIPRTSNLHRDIGPGELTVLVSARVCDTWSEAASVDVEVECAPGQGGSTACDSPSPPALASQGLP